MPYEVFYQSRHQKPFNWGEGHHAVARAICCGQRVENRKCYRKGREVQPAALSLVTNTVVL
ncbi:Tn3 family transposase [Enterobacter vonholyi]